MNNIERKRDPMPLPKKFYQALSLVAMGLVLLGCSVEANTPEATVKKLADWYLKNGFKDGYSALLKIEDAKPLFDPAVIRLLVEAKVERDRQIKAHPGDKPAFVDNTLITGFQDRVDQYRIIETRQWGEIAHSELAWATLGDKTFYDTKVLLRKTPEGWRITDIIYDENDPANRLTEALRIDH
ncbi:hypothetical protein FQ192_33610 [Pseudomonas sp. ANT_J12]|uniref:hypothetical protein n=1 Tax=Pseudomonas sp. ANT_J12 TaxID=2597351 RepID=UPI0011F3C6B3|nr:hypothetical protein [Pseudomonas sp. ANT_J12]KAA0981200.1 hypothetical protein FQ192_33610 [Pseudomonas sp. ANT_J12]